MIKQVIATVLCLWALVGFAGHATADGVWQTFDDKTKEPNGEVRIYEEDSIYYGKIVGSPNPKAKDNKICSKCPDEFKYLPVAGLRFMWGFTRNGNRYTGGHILDPNTGNIYNASMKLTNDGMQLDMRGYLGISLLGSTQKWKRLK